MTVVASLVGLNDAIVITTAAIVGVFMLLRSRSDIWKSNYEGARAKNEQLATELHAAQTELAQLRTLPSIEKLYDLMVRHDTREEEIWKQVVLILNQISDRLDERR